MCIGDGGLDTLREAEVSFLKDAAGRHLPSYVCSLHSNDDAMTWVVLTSEQTGPTMPRFTICRIDPCLLVMTEDRAARRFASASSIEDAMEIACHAALGAVLAINNFHDLPATTQ